MQRLSGAYDRSWGLRAGKEADWKLPTVLSLLESSTGQALLDVGCGPGALMEAAAPRFRHVHGVDVSAEALRSAAVHGQVQQIDLNGAPLPYHDNTFDVVTCLDVIEHVIDPVALLGELARVTKQLGHVVIATPNVRYLKHIITLVLYGRFPRTSLDTSMYDGGHLHYFTFEDLLALGINAGLTPIIRRGVVASPRLLWARRFLCLYPVAEFCCAGQVIVFSKDGRHANRDRA